MLYINIKFNQIFKVYKLKILIKDMVINLFNPLIIVLNKINKLNFSYLFLILFFVLFFYLEPFFCFYVDFL